METKKKTKKRKKRYTLVLMPMSPDKEIKQLPLYRWYVKGLIFLSVVLIFLLVVYGVMAGTVNEYLLQRQKTEIEELSGQVDELTEENSLLTTEVNELTDKNTVLANTVNEKVAAEDEEEQKRIPSGFPILGTTSIEQEPTEELMATEGYVPIIIFKASKGVTIVSSGYGTVTEIVADETYGYKVTIDHGNGYQSIYLFKSEPTVKEGDEITGGTMLGETTEDDETIGYQILLDSNYIDPMTIMEIYG